MPPPAGDAATAMLSRLVLADILDDEILGARPGDKSFPLRTLLGAIGEHVATDDHAFALASGLNFFFRAEMDDEARMRTGLETSKLFYTFAEGAGVDRVKAAPLLAALLSTQTERLRFESVDHVQSFDSQLAERDKTSDPTSARVKTPLSFLARVTTTNAVRVKALVRT
jgi:hypothetical protein